MASPQLASTASRQQGVAPRRAVRFARVESSVT
nr:MAG TPA: hypothetical protein [Caudoviricetes sp.]